MDIVITLPSKLCTEILVGRKTVEVRKNFPKNFNCSKDKVYVIMKGTRYIVMTFTVTEFERYDSPLLLWRDYCYKICVHYGWFMRYATGSKVMYAWKIGSVHLFLPYKDAKKHLGITHNPQSFIYVPHA